MRAFALHPSSLLSLAACAARAAELPIFDAHVHYSHDAWDNLPPKEAIAILRRAGITRALVSSSGDEGTQRLVAEAPDLVLPSLRPYRTRGDIATWVRDESVVRVSRGSPRPAALRRHRRVPPVRRRCRSAGAAAHGGAREAARSRAACPFRSPTRSSACSARTRRRASSGRTRASSARRPSARCSRKHRNLWCDLAFRSEQGAGGKVPAEWRALFTEFPDRFMVGTDTYTPERWHYIVEHAAWSRAWLADLPPPLAERIAWRNADALFAGSTPARSQ